MPILYDYVCLDCLKEFEMVLPITECDEQQYCEKCGGKAKKVIKRGFGGHIRTDFSPWVRSVGQVLTDGDRPSNIETIQDLRRYYAEHPNVRPVSDHPMLDSSLGDYMYQRPDPVAKKKERSKRAHKKLAEMRRINLSSRAA